MRAVAGRSEAGPSEGAWPSANPRRGGGARITGSQRRCACGCLSEGSRLPTPLPGVPSRPPPWRPRPRVRRTVEPGRDRSPDPAAGASSGGIGRGRPAAQARRAHARPAPPPSSPPTLSPSPPLTSPPPPSLRCGWRKNAFRPAWGARIVSHSRKKKRPRARNRPAARPGASEVARRLRESPRPAQPPEPHPAAAA